MTLFQLLLLGATAFFAFQVYQHVRTLKDDEPKLPSDNGQHDTAPAHRNDTRSVGVAELIAKADEAFGQEDLNNARVYLERAEKEEPSNPEVLNKLGFVLDRQGEQAEALAKYEASLRLEPNDDLTHNAIAGVLRRLGRPDEAQEHYKSAVDIDDRYEVTYYNYGQLLLEKGDREGARMMFGKALELKPDYAEAREALEALS